MGCMDTPLPVLTFLARAVPSARSLGAMQGTDPHHTPHLAQTPPSLAMSGAISLWGEGDILGRPAKCCHFPRAAST